MTDCRKCELNSNCPGFAECPHMTDIRDNPPPLSEAQIDELMRASGLESVANKDFRIGRGQHMTAPEQDRYDADVYFARQIEAAVFTRGVTAGQAAAQGEIERLKAFIESWVEHGSNVERLLLTNQVLKAKFKALEEQKPVASVYKTGAGRHWMSETLSQLPDGLYQLYTAAGAKP